MAMGISAIVLMENMPAVVFSVIIGTTFGLVIHLGEKVNVVGCAMQKLISVFVKKKIRKFLQKNFSLC